MLNRLLCRCVEKNVMACEINAFGSLNFFFLVILYELVIKFKCVPNKVW